jgi:hypothetical protein
MKKSKILKAILSPIIKGLAIFAIFGFALYVYASVDWPDDQPNPVTGVVGQLVGFTNPAVNGGRSGYKIANDLCDTAVTGSHICTADEISRSYAYSNAVLIAATASPGSTPAEYFVWINSGAPGFTANANDCLGWNSAAITSYGAIWNIKSKFFAINTCDQSRRFACCK